MKKGLQQFVYACVLFCVVAFSASACAGMPQFLAGQGGNALDQLGAAVQDKVREDYMAQLQTSIQGMANVAQDLQNTYNAFDALCASPDSPSFQTDVAALYEVLASNVETGQRQVKSTQQILEDGNSWLTRTAETSEEAAQATQEVRTHVQQAMAGTQALAELLDYQQKLLQAKNALGAPPENPTTADQQRYYEDTWAAYASYDAIQAPQCMQDVHAQYVDLWEMAGTCFYNATLVNSSSELNRRGVEELVDWLAAKEAKTLRQQSWVAASQCAYACDLLTNKLDPQAEAQVEFRAIERIAPNLYQSLDSVLDVTIRTQQTEDVIVEVEVAGLSQAFTTKVSLQPGVNYFALKPELLPSLSAESLQGAYPTQINFKISDSAGNVLEQQSAKVEVLSLYDYIWQNDEFGFAAQFELFAWLRPGQEVIDNLNRRAAEYVGQWTDGQYVEMNGYQYGQDWYATLLQAAAIQKAMSDSNIAYIIDTYTPTADQRVLTPAAVFEREQAICIESSLVMASALLSAGMHPMVIITPGHAQVAVETWTDSGNYFLIETAQLPYSGIDRGMDSGSSWAYGGLTPTYDDGAGSFGWVESGGASDTWARYFNWVEDPASDTYGGIFVLDCYWQRYFGIYGLENM